jgi:hypothetical protein
MFFWYARALGRWAPRKSADQPYKIGKEDRKNLWPFTDQGLGYALDMHDRKLTIEQLVDKFPPPEETVQVYESEPVPVNMAVEALREENRQLRLMIQDLQADCDSLRLRIKSESGPSITQHAVDMENENAKLKTYIFELEQRLKERHDVDHD